MAKNVIMALLLIVLSVLVMIFNTHSMDVNLLFTTIRATASLVFLFFVVMGVVIGILLK